MIRGILPLRGIEQSSLPKVNMNVHESFANLAGQHLTLGDIASTVLIVGSALGAALFLTRFVNKHPDLFD